MKNKLEKYIDDYNNKKHGNSEHFNQTLYIQKNNGNCETYAPINGFLKSEKIDLNSILNLGYTHSSLDVFPSSSFEIWYKNQYSKPIGPVLKSKISIYYVPNQIEIFKAVEKISECYKVFREHHVLINRKKLPVQLGEWYAKIIFGLEQNKSTSQRGFDFYLDGQRVEVQVSWGDKSNPKGIKFRKSLVDMSKFCILIFLSDNLMVRDICFLDSEFVIRKYSSKGHFIFLKEAEIKQYNFSQSNKQKERVKNSGAMFRFAGPIFAMKASELFGEK